MVLRYLYLHRRSLPRTFEIVLWPVMELLVWGYLTLYLRSFTPAGLAKGVVFLVNSMIFWDILYRSQQGVSLSLVEEVWTRNLINVLASPLRIWEWFLAAVLYGLAKIAVIVTLLSVLAFLLFQFHVLEALGLYLIPLAANLFLFGWALGLFTSSLLLRWGSAAESLIWAVPFLVQPFSAVFYPLEILPAPLRAVSILLPSTHVFEGIRLVLQTGTLPLASFWTALSLNVGWFVAAGLFFRWMYAQARDSGRLSRLGMD